MNTAVAYAKLAGELLIDAEHPDGGSSKHWPDPKAQELIAKAQVYATLAQAAATKEMRDSIILSSSPAASW